MKHPNPDNIYAPEFVEHLFERMSATYDRVNRITSFGFSTRWRRQCVQALNLKPGMKVVDFMTGMGEAWPYILSDISSSGHLIAIDFCPAMTRMAEKRRAQWPGFAIDLRTEDALHCSLPDQCADAAVATFALKTFLKPQMEQFAAEIRRVLRPGGVFSLIEVSLPANPLLGAPYMFYLKNIIPRLGKAFLGYPESYRMLGVYTEAFKNCRLVMDCFERAGLEVQYVDYFGGCASGLLGNRI